MRQYPDGSSRSAFSVNRLLLAAAIGIVIPSGARAADGMEIFGAAAGDRLGSAVVASGDVNRDGVGDLLASAELGVNPFLPGGGASGYAVVIPGMTPSAFAQVALSSPSGDAVLTGFGGRMSPTLRAWAGYSGGSASVTTAALSRLGTAPANLPSDSAGMKAAWQLSTDRADWTSATVAFRYTDAEIPGGIPESALRVFRGPSVSGPWAPLPTTIDVERNLARADVESLAWYTLAQSDCALGYLDLESAASSYAYGSSYSGTLVSGMGFTDPNLVLLLRADGHADRSIWFEVIGGDDTSATLRFRVDQQPDWAAVAPPLGTFDLVASNGSCDVAWPSAVTVTSSGGSSCLTAVDVACGAAYFSATGPLLPSGSNESWFSVPVPAGESLTVGLVSSGGMSFLHSAIYESCSDSSPLAEAEGAGYINVGVANPTASSRSVLVKVTSGSSDYETSFSCALLPTGAGASCLTPYQVAETATFSPVPAEFSSTSVDRAPCHTAPNTVSYWIELLVPARQAVDVRAWGSGASHAVGVDYYDSCGDLALDAACGASDVTSRLENERVTLRTLLALVTFDAADPDRNLSVTYSGLPPAGSSCAYPRTAVHGDAFGEGNPVASDLTTHSECLNTSAAPRWLRMEVPPLKTATVAAASGIGDQAELLSVTFTQFDCGAEIAGASACGAGLVSASWWNDASTTATVLARIDSDAETSHPEMLVWMEESVPAGWTCLAPFDAGCGTSVDTLTSMPASGARVLSAFTGGTSAPVAARWLAVEIPSLVEATLEVTVEGPESSVTVALFAGCTGAVLSEQIGAQAAAVSSANFGATTSTVLALINTDRSTTPPIIAVTCRPADQTPPVVVIDSPTSGVWHNSVPVLLDWYSSEELLSTSATLWRTAFDGTEESHAASDWQEVTGEGQFLLQVEGTDLAGNESETTSTWFGIDLTSPTVLLVLLDPFTSQTSVTLRGEAGDSSILQSALWEALLQVDGGAWETVQSWSGLTTDSLEYVIENLAEGPHTVRLQVTDMAGNASQIQEQTVTVDLTAPGISVSAPSPARTSAGPVSFTVSFSGASTVTLNAADVVVTATGSSTSTLVFVSGEGLESRTVTLDGVSGDGELSILILTGTARDEAGNLAGQALSQGAAVVDNTRPDVAVDTPTSTAWYNFVPVLLDWSVSEAISVTSATLTRTAFDGAITADSVSDEDQATSEGRLLLQVQVTDLAGNDSRPHRLSSAST